jgi:hypothetical protein
VFTVIVSVSLGFYAAVQLFVGVFTLVVFPKVAFSLTEGERRKDGVLIRFFSIYDLILCLRQ